MAQTNPSPIVETVAQTIKTQLQSFAAPRGGIVQIVENESHLWEEMYNGKLPTTQPKVFILWTGETARGEYAGGDKTSLHRVDRHWMVVIMRGHGFRKLLAEGIGPEPAPGAPAPPAGSTESFYNAVETLRDGIRVLQGISEEFPVDYLGITALPNIGPNPEANVFMDCRVIRFDTAADIPALTLSNATWPGGD
jgi:hypothetical protein